MHPILLRATHEITALLHEQQTTNEFKHYLLYFLVSYLILVLAAFLYLKNQASSKYSIPVLPYDEERFFIQLTMIVIMGAVALVATLAQSWTKRIWTFYAISNLLQAAFIFVYHRSISYSLIISSLLMCGTSVIYYYLFKELAEGISGVTILCLVGVVQAWALIWFMVVLGQVLVYEFGLQRRTQTIIFFIVATVLFLLVGYWHRLQGVGWLSLIGYIFCGVALLTFMLFRCYNHSLL